MKRDKLTWYNYYQRLLDGSFDQRWWRRFFVTLLLTGQVILRLFRGKIYQRQILEQLVSVGLGCLNAVLLVSFFCGMIFTLQSLRNLSKFGGIMAVGGAFAFTFCRELSPLVTAGIVSGQMGSSFAAEIGEMQVTEQVEVLLILRTNPIDYLVIPRVIACCIMVPILTTFSLVLGILGGIFVAGVSRNVSPLTFLDAVRTFLTPTDLLLIIFKSMIFGFIVALVGCGWGLTTKGGSKQVGRSTTAAVVTATVLVFIADFIVAVITFGSW